MDPMMTWPGLRTALTPERAAEVLAQHTRAHHRLAGCRLVRVCHACGEQTPCRQRRWALAELARADMIDPDAEDAPRWMTA